MTIVPGKVVNGRIEVEDLELPEGAEVTVYYAARGEELSLSEEQKSELDDSIAQIERGEFVDGDEAIRELRRRRGL
jgi:hypothetical protein